MQDTLVISFLVISAAAINAFVWYWYGVGMQQIETRKWARRALTAENIAESLHVTNGELTAYINSRMAGERPLTPAERHTLKLIERHEIDTEE